MASVFRANDSARCQCAASAMGNGENDRHTGAGGTSEITQFNPLALQMRKLRPREVPSKSYQSPLQRWAPSLGSSHLSYPTILSPHPRPDPASAAGPVPSLSPLPAQATGQVCLQPTLSLPGRMAISFHCAAQHDLG